jgi:hypothetical protein
VGLGLRIGILRRDTDRHPGAGQDHWQLASIGWVSADAHSVGDKFGYYPIGFVRGMTGLTRGPDSPGVRRAEALFSEPVFPPS